MYTRFTITNVLLVFFAAIASSLVVLCKTHYWQVIDVLALPFYEVPDFSNAKYPDDYSVLLASVIQFVDSVKSGLLDMTISGFGYDISAPFIYLFGIVSLLCIAYLLLCYKNRVSFLPVLCLLAGSTVLLSVNSGVTIEQVGRSISAKYDSVHPDENYVELLRNKQFSELDAHLKNTEEQFMNNVIPEREYVERYKIFETANKDDLAHFRRWLDSTADRKNALLARGILYDSLGWYARGRKLAKDTTHEEFTRMRNYFNKSIDDLNAVLELDEKSLLAHAYITVIAAASGSGLDKHDQFNRGLRSFPTSHYLAASYMSKLQPKWGGSYHQIRDVAQSMREQAVRNPLLITLGKVEIHYRMKKTENDKDDTEHVKLKRFSALYGANVQEIVNLSLYYDNKNDNDNAISILSYGLRLFPQNARLLLHRAYHYALDENHEFATMDISNLVPEDIINPWESDRAADLYGQLHQPGKGIPFYIRSIELNPANEYSYNRLYWLSHKKIMSYDDALPYLQQWTEEFPQSSDAWIGYASTLEHINEKSSIPAYKQFLKYADRSNSNDMKAVNHVEKLINKFNAGNM